MISAVFVTARECTSLYILIVDLNLKQIKIVEVSVWSIKPKIIGVLWHAHESDFYSIQQHVGYVGSQWFRELK